MVGRRQRAVGRELRHSVAFALPAENTVNAWVTRVRPVLVVRCPRQHHRSVRLHASASGHRAARRYPHRVRLLRQRQRRRRAVARLSRPRCPVRARRPAVRAEARSRPHPAVRVHTAQRAARHRGVRRARLRCSRGEAGVYVPLEDPTAPTLTLVREGGCRRIPRRARVQSGDAGSRIAGPACHP